MGPSSHPAGLSDRLPAHRGSPPAPLLGERDIVPSCQIVVRRGAKSTTAPNQTEPPSITRLDAVLVEDRPAPANLVLKWLTQLGYEAGRCDRRAGQACRSEAW